MYRLLLLNFVDSFIDNCILSCVDEPAYGGIVQCELLFGLAAHSGIYVFPRPSTQHPGGSTQ